MEELVSFNPTSSVLFVGEGNFSFSNLLTEHWQQSLAVTNNHCNTSETNNATLNNVYSTCYEDKPVSAGKEAAEAAGFSHTDRRQFRPPGGENQDDVEKRARSFLSKLIKNECVNKKEGNNILVVSHGIILREVFKILFEKDIGEKQILEERKAMLLKGCGPNTGRSKFNLTVEPENSEIISTKCLVFLSDEHLDI